MTVVVGYVPDATGYLAVTEAVREAGWRGTDVVIVNVVGPTGYTTPTSADEKDLDALEARLTADSVQFSIEHVSQSTADPAEHILQVAEKTKADLIVVGLKRRSSVAKALLGSNAQKVILGAQCPVMAVRAEDD